MNKVLKDFLAVLKDNNIPVPEELTRVSAAFNKALLDGGYVAKEDLDAMERLLFPDIPMGDWCTDVKSRVSKIEGQRLDDLLGKLYRCLERS